MKWGEGFLLILYVIAVIIWWWYRSALYAHLILVSAAIIAFFPIIINTWNDPMVEDAAPWYIWTVAYVLLFLVVVLRWEKWVDAIYPVVSIFLSILVAVLALDRRIPKTMRFKNI